jgi:integrase
MRMFKKVVPDRNRALRCVRRHLGCPGRVGVVGCMKQAGDACHRTNELARPVSDVFEFASRPKLRLKPFHGLLRRSNFLRRSYFPIVKAGGVPRIRVHDLRHTAATLLLLQGVHPKVVQERLGHATIAIALDTYSHVLPSLQREAAAKLDSLLG